VTINAYFVRFAALLKALDVVYSASGNIIYVAIKFMTVTSVGFVINYDVSKQYSLSTYIGVL